MKKSQNTCKHCNHTWVPRKENPKKCPHCGRNGWGAASGQSFILPGSDSSAFPGLGLG
jgi:hypothetical protein